MKNNSLETIFSPRDAAHAFLVKASDSLFKAGKTSSRRKADYVCVHIRRLVWKWNRSSVQICDETYWHVQMPAMKCQTEGKIRTLTLTLSREDTSRKDHLKFEAMNNMPHLGRSYFIQVKEQPSFVELLKIAAWFIFRRWIIWPSSFTIHSLWLSPTTPFGQKGKFLLVFVQFSQVKTFLTVLSFCQQTIII